MIEQRLVVLYSALKCQKQEQHVSCIFIWISIDQLFVSMPDCTFRNTRYTIFDIITLFIAIILISNLLQFIFIFKFLSFFDFHQFIFLDLLHIFFLFIIILISDHHNKLLHFHLILSIDNFFMDFKIYLIFLRFFFLPLFFIFLLIIFVCLILL